MAPQLTDAQKRTDDYFDHLVSLWSGMDPRARTSPEGMGLVDQILGLARRRSGDAASLDVARQLGRSTTGTVAGDRLRDQLDGSAPRVDSDTNATVAVPNSPAIADTTPMTLGKRIGAAEPGDGRKWLPGNATLPPITSGDSEHIDTADAAIEDINQKNFRVDSSSAWRPEGAALPVTGTNISTLGSTYSMTKDLIQQWGLAVEKLRDAVTSSGEQLITEQFDRLRQPLKTLTDDAAVSKSLPDLIARGGIAANDAFHDLRGQELTIRQAMADIASMPAHNIEDPYALGRTTPDGSYGSLPAVTVPTKVAEVQQIGKQISDLATKISAPEVLVGKKVDSTGEASGSSTATGSGSEAAPQLRPGTVPVAAAGPGGSLPGTSTGSKDGVGKAGPKGGRAGDDLSSLLAALGQTAAPLAQQAASAPQQATAAAQPLTSAAQQAANKVPDELLKSLRGDKADNVKLPAAATPAAKAAEADRSAATSVAYTPPPPASAASLGAPGTDARPHQLDATGKPVDKDHTGKVSKDAVALSKHTVKPFDLAVDAHGHNVQVRGVGDPRLGEMMLNMAGASDAKPMSVLDAAKASGMNITSLGDPVDPSSAEIGDAVIGAVQSGMYLGDDLVLTTAGGIESLADVLGDDGFVSHIPLPELPDDAPAHDPGNPGPPAPEPHTVTASTVSPDPTAPHPASTLPDNPPPATAPPAATEQPPTPADPPQPPPLQPAAPINPQAPPSDSPPLSAPTAVQAKAPDGRPVPRQVPYEGHALG
ncbi:hypothetical protein [Mycolicibacterium aubagnense]|uniref:Uncharacterized protein n=1 Tax=Mycolicibacterium aubagnense TaxID=319707 RepID=A0ABN5YMT8_9MYCO|nr:hypothetical protein [Mycolicibacterium aubagnense]TLH48966.1 hypothetical protein C1S80_29210 [Mycolicibacterium aubagnense]BBX82252.1 hypothetical protein MAUB_01250 [Mycolicibacterium aubagnense]